MSTDLVLQKLLNAWKWAWGYRNIWARSLFSLVVGLTIYYNQGTSSYDLRLKLRGPFLRHDKVVVVQISEREWGLIRGEQENYLTPLDDLSPVADSYYWDENTWAHILNKTFSHNPSAIGISFIFGPNIAPLTGNTQNLSLLKEERIIWAAGVDPEGRVIFPRFSSAALDTAGTLDLTPDGDGILRRYFPTNNPIDNFANRVVEKHLNQEHSEHSEEPFIINFQGPRKTFPTVSLYELLTEPEDSNRFKGKILIFGAKDSPGHQFQTPMGPMTKGEILANITDNILFERRISNIPSEPYAALLLLIVILSAWIIFRLNQLSAFIFHFFAITAMASFSIWCFDTLYFFIPILPMIVCASTSYIINLTYQSSMNQQRAWKLERETQALYEVEQLKQNFVSLFSHDLKTPIAKIQGALDRLINENKDNNELRSSLDNLRGYSHELDRYIKSILKVSRVEASDFRIKLSPSDINSLIEEAVNELEPLSRDKSIKVSMSLEPMFSAEIDPILIKEVIINLIDNAIKYTPKNGQIEIASGEDNDMIRVTIKDTGAGIPGEEIPNIWNKFYRVGNVDDGQSKGSGLGLYLVKFFVELHHGEVFIESELGKGTSIGFVLPVEYSG